jgi:hypothetical protein
MKDNNHRVRVMLACTGHTHELCVPIGREVPKELRCDDQQQPGYGGGGGGCRVPEDLVERVLRQLRDSLQDARRRGHVLIEV